MKRPLLLLTLATLGFARVASAAPACTDGTLATYEALGTTGCTIGSVTLDGFATLLGSTGATELAPTAVSITPSTSGDPTLTFNVSQSASAGTIYETMFTYIMSGASFISADIALSNSSETVDGAVSDVQNICDGGHFTAADGVDGCNGVSSIPLVTVDGAQNTDNSALSGAMLLNITDDVTIDSGPSGTGGTAQGATFVDHVAATSTTTVAEPPTFLLILAGLTLLLITIRRRDQGESHAYIAAEGRIPS